MGNRVKQRFERRAAIGALEEEIGVGGYAKGRFLEAEVI
jgi:hypothetical protein